MEKSLFEFGPQPQQYEVYQARRRQNFLERMERKLMQKEILQYGHRIDPM